MKSALLITCVTWLLLGCVLHTQGQQPLPDAAHELESRLPTIIPTPGSMQRLEGQQPFEFNQTTRIVCMRQLEGVALPISQIAEVLAEELELITGIRPEVVASDKQPSTPNDIVLGMMEKVQGDFGRSEVHWVQRYELNSSASGVQVFGTGYKGLCYGTASLLQALDLESLTIPALEIRDSSAASYRAVMIDVARKVHSIGVIQDVVRLCRLYKVRYLHLHLTDDQNFTFPFAPVTDNLKGNFCYTKEQLKELVAYADARGVTIIPEFDLPGHSTQLKRSGYLVRSDSDADVAAPENFEKINAIVDEMLDVFHSSPYFHIGGDESGAGQKLIPFLKAVNQRVRKRGKRLLVWEGFHGSPTEKLPATGDDRIIVMSWESSYNAPWDLLESGYEIINASWKPMYVVGGYGGMIHAGSSGGKWFALQDIYRWNKDTFMHWEPGRAVYDDRGPNDSNRTDHEWNASWINKQDQILGGQLLYWEQREGSVIHYLRHRVPVMAERLWNPESSLSFEQFQANAANVDQKVFSIVQPVEITPVMDASLPVTSLYQSYEGKNVAVTLRNRSKVPGKIRYSLGEFSGSLGAPNFRPVPLPEHEYSSPLSVEGAFGIRAELVRKDGSVVGGNSWSFYNNWPMRVEVTEYDLGGKRFQKVPDLAALPEKKILRRFQMPYVRGRLQNVVQVGQMSVAELVAPADGQHTFELRTQSGHATLYVDLNQDGTWDADEILIRDTPNTEKGQTAHATLKQGQRYRLRIDHSTGIPRPVLNLLISKPGQAKPVSIAPFLELPSDR